METRQQDGSEESNSHLGINKAADKKEWKYWMGGLLPILERQRRRKKDYHFKQFKNYILPPFSKGLCNLKILKQTFKKTMASLSMLFLNNFSFIRHN